MSFVGGSKSAFSSDQNVQNAYLHATLQQIDQLANDDVEMQAPMSEYAIFIVVDTNVILHRLEVLKQFVADVERLSLPVIIIVPGAVTLELDSQKKRVDLGFFARAGSTWLLEKVSQRRVVKAQANAETCKTTRNWKIREHGEMSNSEMHNDNLILDCCMYFSRSRPTILCSADNNLCIDSQAQDIPTICPSHHWSSRELAYSIYGDRVDLSQFEMHKESYEGMKGTGAGSVVVDDDDAMMKVDEEDDSNWTPQHPLNLLHEAVIEHFTRLLIELVGRIGGEEVRQRTAPGEEARMSRHAPRRQHYSEWTAAQCLDYLNERKRIKPREPTAQKFLLKVHTKVAVPYARRGWEWSRRQWEVALENLKETGSAWGDVSISESLFYLQPHVEAGFACLRVGT